MTGELLAVRHSNGRTTTVGVHPGGPSGTASADASVVDDPTHGLVARSGPRGDRPLFWRTHAGATAVGTDPDAVARAVGPLAPSPVGLASYLLLNYPVDDLGYLAGVHTLPAGRPYRVTADGVTALPGPPSPAHDGAAPDPAADPSLTAALTAALCVDGRPVPASHLSGGLDTSILVHLWRRVRPAGTLRTYTAFVRPDDPDRIWAATVAAEVRSDPVEVALPGGTPFLEAIDDLVRRLASPVMAIGIVTFLFLARAARDTGDPVLLTGVGADHPFVGWTRLARLAASGPHDPRVPDFVRCCVHVEPEVVRAYVDPDALGGPIDEVIARVAGFPRSHETAAEAIERFHAEQFLPEHLRCTRVAHAAARVAVHHPFLGDAALREGHRLAPTAGAAVDKAYLRRELGRLGSAAAGRPGKQQMALDFDAFRTLARARLADLLDTAAATGLGLHRQRLRALALSHRPASRSELRLLWLTYCYLTWWLGRAPAPGGPTKEVR